MEFSFTPEQEAFRDRVRSFIKDNWTPPPPSVHPGGDEANALDRAYEKRLAGEKDIFFTIQYPRQASKHPTETDLAGYRDWFKNVPHGFEIPRPGP